MLKINLLPKEEVQELRLELISSQVFQFWLWTIITLGIVFALSLSGTFLIAQKIDANKAEIENKKRSLSSESTKQLEQEVSNLNRQIA
ncbi:MAG TPA: hypothetical protein VEC17_02395, partial [Candidatus Binatia bacterium]|nr:hypothetical protein [Candidatus Binatia bacterium]